MIAEDAALGALPLERRRHVGLRNETLRDEDVADQHCPGSRSFSLWSYLAEAG